jgi:hypothetical protein
VEMILIPAGDFPMGEGDDAHAVYLAAFHIAKYPDPSALPGVRSRYQPATRRRIGRMAALWSY